MSVVTKYVYGANYGMAAQGVEDTEQDAWDAIFAYFLALKTNDFAAYSDPENHTWGVHAVQVDEGAWNQ